MKPQKTNAMRLLESLKLPYEPVSYPSDGTAIEAARVAELLNEPPERIFKTLVLLGSDSRHYVCLLPGPRELDLNLSYNYVSDYSPLYSLSALERLWLYQSNGYNKGQMDRGTLREIRAQLPGCDVNGVSGGTNGGWREHPRYPVIFDIFKTSVYKPFNQE